MNSTTPIEVLKRIEECKRIKSNELYLDGFGLTRIPVEINELTRLEKLNLNNNQITKIEGLDQLVNLEILDLSINSITDIEGLDKLINLKTIYLYNNRINKIEGLDKLENLISLYLGHNQINKIEGLDGLENLPWLNLEHNQITKIEELDKLTNLSRLDLANNQITKIEGLNELVNLKELELNHNQITKIEGLNELASLEVLNLVVNQITKIEGISQLLNLKRLNFGGNQIIKIEGLDKLINLVVLNLRANKINKIEGLEKLENLTQVDFIFNQIKDISPLIPFIKRGINIYYRDSAPKDKNPIYLEHNPIEIPDIETVMRGNEAILNYFNEIEESKKYELENKEVAERIKKYDIAKLVLVGNSNVGKTNFSSFLRTGKLSKRKSTHGMTIDTWNLEKENLQVRIWDFGGQEYYHNTYRLLFQGNCLFNLLWDAKDNRNYIEKGCLIDETKEEPIREDVQHFENEYWLDNISHYASETSEIFLIQNKDDDLKNRVRIEPKLYNNYTKLKEDFAISLEKEVIKNAEQIKRFGRLKEDIISKISEIKISIKSHDRLNIRNLLIDFQDGNIKKNNPFKQFEGKLYISKEEFNTILQQEKLATDLTQETVISEFIVSLQQQGLVLYYPKIQELRDYIFINPLKLSDEIYRILSQNVRENSGIYINTNEQDEVLLHLMLQMEIIFKVPNAENEYIAPQYLPESHVLQGLYEIASEEIQQSSYSVKLPLFYYRRVMQQLILYYGKNQDANCKAYFWKHGILIKKDGIRLLIKGLYPNENESEGIVLVATTKEMGHLKLQKEVFEKIIGKDWNKLQAAQLSVLFGQGIAKVLEFFKVKSVPFDENKYLEKYIKKLDRLEVSTDGIYFVRYIDLHQKAEDGELRIEGKHKTDKSKAKSLKTIDFQMILDNKVKKPLKMFISYSHKNRALFEVFKEELEDWKISLGYEEIEIFEDTKLVVGEPWDEQLKKELNHCDLGILLVSQPFLNSKYIKNEEFGIMNERTKRNEMVMFPIYFSTCNFSAWEELAKLQLHKESGEYYGHPNLKEQMSYADLVEWLPNGAVKPNPHRERYMQTMIEKIKMSLDSLKK